MIVFALFVSVVFGALMRDEPKEQLRFGAQSVRGVRRRAALRSAGCCTPSL